MIPLATIGQTLGGRWLVPGDGEAHGASIDTRSLEAGQVFFALPGTRVDGHDYLPQAAARGAAIAVVQRELPTPEGLAVLLVDDVKASLWKLAEHYRTMLRATVVAVMGSNGKTTTVRMLASVLREAMPTHASARSFNNALGLPLTILNCPADAQAMVCELGEGEPGALARFVSLARPDITIVTSVGRAHVGELGGMDAVRGEFSAALDAMQNRAGAVVPHVECWLQASGGATFATERAWHEGGHACFELADGSTWSLPVPGLHNARNAAAVVCVARKMGLDNALIARGLQSFEPADMRLAVREVSGSTVIVDCYNANPDSMAAALHTLEEVGLGKRTVAVIGDMLELGPDSAAWHAQAGQLAREVADECVFIGPHCRLAHEAGGGRWFASIEDARAHVAALLVPGSVVLLKASRGMALERLLDGLHATAVA